MRIFWLSFFVLTVIAHYPGCCYIFFVLIPKYLGIAHFWQKVCLWLIAWLISGLIFNGCIFTHAEQYCLVRSGAKSTATYHFENSLAYKLVWKYL